MSAIYFRHGVYPRGQQRAIVEWWANQTLGMVGMHGHTYLLSRLLPDADPETTVVSDITPDQLIDAFRRGAHSDHRVADALVSWRGAQSVMMLSHPHTFCILMSVHPLLLEIRHIGSTPERESSLISISSRVNRLCSNADEIMSRTGIREETLVQIIARYADTDTISVKELVRSIISAKEIISHLGAAAHGLTHEVLELPLQPLIQEVPV